jgi:hypothetical protein
MSGEEKSVLDAWTGGLGYVLRADGEVIAIPQDVWEQGRGMASGGGIWEWALAAVPFAESLDLTYDMGGEQGEVFVAAEREAWMREME